MEDSIIIRSVDQATYTTSRALVTTHSRVFADLLDFPPPRDGDCGTVDVEESGSEISVLLAVLSGEEQRRKAALANLGEEGWVALAKAADKYDVEIARMAVQGKFWIRLALYHFGSQPDFVEQMRNAIAGNLCEQHYDWLMGTAANLEEAYGADPPRLV
ncbi:hypothetical protein JCM11641_002873 [Rhodosporidiobolus odoratus]